MVDYNKERKNFVQWVKERLSGEKLKFDEKIQSEILVEPNPFNRYTTGILYPAGVSDEVEDDAKDEDRETSSKTTQSYQPPSSMGFSFYVDSSLPNIKISYKAVRFEHIDSKDSGLSESRKRQWKKIYLDELGIDDGNGNGISINKSSTHYIYAEKARIDIVVRAYGDGKIVTVTLSNTPKDNSQPQNIGDDYFEELKERVEGSLFEVELTCHFDQSCLRNYPRVSKELLTEEEKELELRYKDQHVYAIGHGVAVDWQEANNSEIMLYSDFMPSFEVPQVTAETSDSFSRVLDFEFLQTIETNEAVFEQLNHFVENYLDWINTQEQLKKTEDDDEQITAHNIIERMHTAAKRMRRSISVLESDVKVQKSFALANQAMLAQMQRTRPNNHEYTWRPFQLAFFLMVLESTINEEDDYRDLVDLIWFPTGGGKTEAYLGVMAFLFVYRRLSYTSSGNGTVAIMRYTLRLLTSQQFVRACKVIGALELIRRKEPMLGEEPFSVGLWLGGDSSPNLFSKAIEFKEKQNFSKFVLNECPWCADKFSSENYLVDENNFHFTCNNHNCDFGQEKDNVLPFNVVDEALYNNPPSLLIATVDKFARFAWDEKANVFLGGKKNRPPELIIQDELHLISGALGSIVGIYETGFEAAITSRGVFPKFIASTATIRQASEQIKALFGRDMAVFPPVGLRQKDSYFAKEVSLDEKPGRLYVGYLAFNRQRKNCLEDLAGTLLATPQILFHQQDELKDAWWTQMVYHGSLKGVSNSQTNFQNNIPKVQQRLLMSHFIGEAEKYESNYSERIEEALKSQASYDRFVNGKWAAGREPLESNNISELYYQCFPTRSINTKLLTGSNTAETNTQVFDSLSSNFKQSDAIDAVLATNMVSVGLDEPRLALMVMNGQPLTTAEYIQASSRVGRSSIPGIVFINYYKTQARSLSHYENFRAFHSSFYRFVEPSSLTPFTEQVRNKALHAALVIALRHGENGLLKNTEAENFLSDVENTTATAKIIKKLKQRIKHAATDHTQEVYDSLDLLIDEWRVEASSAMNLRYQSFDKSGRSLLTSFDNDRYSGVWQTLNSMRNVEKTALFEIDLDKNKFVYSNKWFAPVRFSHITGHSGVGSIVYDGIEWLVKVSDTRQWPSESKLVELHAVERVKTYFQTTKKLLLPPEAQIKSSQNIEVKGETLPIQRFPLWMRCTNCDLIHFRPWDSHENNSKLIDAQIFCTADTCKNSKKSLKQVIWCAASKNGELRDVPWHYICHRNQQNKCVQETHTAYLKIKNVRAGKKQIYCTKCNAKSYFEKTVFKGKSGDSYLITEVNDARIYTPHTERALVIPPESNIDRNSIAYQLQSNSQLLSAIQNATRPLQKKREIKAATTKLKCSEKVLMDAIASLEGKETESFTVTNMINDEYNALTTPADFPSGADFVTRHLTNDWLEFIDENISKTDSVYLSSKLIDSLVAVDRLRVIEVFQGFSRDINVDKEDVTSVNQLTESDESEDQIIIPPDIDGSADWLPAIELFGEGIFFTLNSELLIEWESNQHIRLRANEVNQRYQASDLILPDEVVPTPRFIMMHTLAHLLMRELESSAGYPAASLQERIYCSTADDSMAGIMIYTAVPDIAGTLGGIVNLVEPSKFLRLLDNALRQAEWCSLDPVCGEMEKQGPSWLNRAACHACALVPDTCCSYNNVFLDRVFIKGNAEVKIPALADFIRDKNG